MIIVCSLWLSKDTIVLFEDDSINTTLKQFVNNIRSLFPNSEHALIFLIKIEYGIPLIHHSTH